MGGFPIYTEVDTCFEAYLEAYTTFVCRTHLEGCDYSFLDWCVSCGMQLLQVACGAKYFYESRLGTVKGIYVFA